MAKTKTLALTTTPQQIIPKSNCYVIEIKEDESVTGWPTVALVTRKPANTDDPNTLTAGKSVFHKPPPPFDRFIAGIPTDLWVSVASGSTTGVQDET
jgi:hypothetical protein